MYHRTIVTLFVRVWIETMETIFNLASGFVTLFVRVWIETSNEDTGNKTAPMSPSS